MKNFFDELYEYRVSICMGIAAIIGFIAGIIVGLNSLK